MLESLLADLEIVPRFLVLYTVPSRGRNEYIALSVRCNTVPASNLNWFVVVTGSWGFKEFGLTSNFHING